MRAWLYRVWPWLDRQLFLLEMRWLFSPQREALRDWIDYDAPDPLRYLIKYPTNFHIYVWRRIEYRWRRWFPAPPTPTDDDEWDDDEYD